MAAAIFASRVFAGMTVVSDSGVVMPYASRANFVLFELATADRRAVFEALHAEGVLVRDVGSYPRLARCLRVSVGTETENARFLAALRQAVAGEGR